MQEEHDRSRGTACFKQVISGIDLAKKAGIQPILRYGLTLDSIRFLPELVDLAEARGVKVWLEPVYDRKYSLGFFENISLEHIKYYKNHPLVEFSFAALAFVRDRGNQKLWPRCKAVSTVITIFPDNSLAFPCFYLPQKRFKLDGDLFEVYTRPGFLTEIEKGQGKFPECQGCMAFSYMLPSFQIGFDRYFLLQWFSDWWSRRK
jgi:MoaA/NifB/PqqE/SkfB family radical SAM enzyme